MTMFEGSIQVELLHRIMRLSDQSPINGIVGGKFNHSHWGPCTVQSWKPGSPSKHLNLTILTESGVRRISSQAVHTIDLPNGKDAKLLIEACSRLIEADKIEQQRIRLEKTQRLEIERLKALERKQKQEEAQRKSEAELRKYRERERQYHDELMATIRPYIDRIRERLPGVLPAGYQPTLSSFVNLASE